MRNDYEMVTLRNYLSTEDKAEVEAREIEILISDNDDLVSLVDFLAA